MAPRGGSSQEEEGGPRGNEIGEASYFCTLCADAEEGYYRNDSCGNSLHSILFHIVILF